MSSIRQCLKVILFAVIVNCQLTIINCFAKGAGSSAVPTLMQPVSAKVAGMGEAYTAVSGEVVSMHYNPAGLSSMEGVEITTMYQRGLDEDNFANVLFGKGFPFGAVGMSILYYDTGKIEMYDTNGNEINKVGQRDIIVTVGVGIPLYKERLGIGVNLKGISSEIFGETASAVAMDAGVQYRGLMKGIDLGFAVQNVGSKLKYVSKGDDLPMIVRFGAVYKVGSETNRVRTSIDVPYYVNEEETRGSIGIEYIYDSLFAIRGGYKIKSSSDDEQGINAGIGFIWKSFSIDYAIGFTNNLDNPHHISMNMKF